MTSSSLILEREFRRQASEGSAVIDQEKFRAVNGKKVCCKATLLQSHVYYASRDTLCARPSTCVQLHEHRYRKGGPGVLHQETPQFGI